METTYFHITKTGKVLGTHFFCIDGGPKEQFGTHEKLILKEGVKG